MSTTGSSPCYIRGCLARNANRRMPSQEWRYKYWKQFCRPLPSKRWIWTRICDKHFSDDQFNVVNGKKILKKNAVPTLRLPFLPMYTYVGVVATPILSTQAASHIRMDFSSQAASSLNVISALEAPPVPVLPPTGAASDVRADESHALSAVMDVTPDSCSQPGPASPVADAARSPPRIFSRPRILSRRRAVARSADSRKAGTSSSVVRNDAAIEYRAVGDDDDIEILPPVETDGGEAAFATCRATDVSATDACPESDPLELMLSERRFKEENVPESILPTLEGEIISEDHQNNADIDVKPGTSRQQLPACDITEAARGILCETSDSDEDSTCTPDVPDNLDIQSLPDVKMEVEETEFISQEIGWVSGSEESSEADPLELTSCEVKCEEQEEEEDPVLEPPLFADFMGFAEVDLKKALEAVHSKVKLLSSYISEQQTGNNAPSNEEARNRRPADVVSYSEEADADIDSTSDATGSYCDECDREWAEGCPLHGPMEVVPDTKVPSDTGDPERCIKTLPHCLNYGRSNIPVANTGVLAEKDLAERQRFGPYEGTITPGEQQAKTIGYSWQIKQSDSVEYYVADHDPGSSNWLSMVNCARTEQEQNLIAFQHKGQVYYRTCKPIAKGSELLVYFGDDSSREPNVSVQPCAETEKTPTAEQAGPSTSDAEATICCPHCDYRCLGQALLDRHVKERHGHIDRKGTHKCEWCKYSTDNASELLYHRITHTLERQHRCDVCGKTFKKLSNLAHHCWRHDNQRPHKCDICEKTFTKRSDLARHRLRHDNQRPHKCDICEKTFTKHSDLTRHRLRHDNQRPHKCDICEKTFTKKHDLTIHQRIHTGERPHCCSICGKTFIRKSHLKTHQLVHTGERPHECDICKKRFTEKSYLAKHRRIMHSCERPHGCSICGKTFACISLLKTHQLEHTDQWPHECDICKKRFKEERNMKAHRRNMHTGERPHCCGVCGETFRLRTLLTNHCRAHHAEGIRIHHCAICNTTFGDLGDLNRHRYVHTGKTLHQCDICGKGYVRSEDLEIHQRMHAGDHPYQCENCKKVFSRNYNLEVHRRIHTGERHCCDVCGKTFSKRSRLTSHQCSHS